METKKIIIAALFFLLCYALCAQQPGYFLDYSEGSPKFIQRLVWNKEEYALYYEVLIFVDENGYREFLKDTTEDNLFLVSLPPGKYRYSVTPYDLLGIRGETSEWIEFEVIHAFQPVIDSFTPEFFYLDKNNARVLRITGVNLSEESDIYLHSVTGDLIPEKITITNDREATLVFNDLGLIPGDYDICVRNPGGLDTSIGKFVIGYQKPTDFFLKLSWAPAIPTSGHLLDILGTNMFPFGVSLSLEMVSSTRGFFNGGLELVASVFYLDPVISLQPNSNLQMDLLNAVSETHFAAFDLNFVLQHRFNSNRMAFSFRFGVGIVIVGSAISSSGSYIENIEFFEKHDIIMQLNFGADFFIRLFNNFYIEAGLDFNNHFSSGFAGMIKPKLGLVLQF